MAFAASLLRIEGDLSGTTWTIEEERYFLSMGVVS
jgi:hypothetical protein